MTTVKTTSVQIKSSDTKGSGLLEYETATNKQLGVIRLTWNGGSVIFSTYADYHSFVSEIVIPVMDILNSPSGSGVGFIAASSGTAGVDKVIN